MNPHACLSLVKSDGWNVILPLSLVWSPDDEPSSEMTIRPLVDPPLALDWVVVESSRKVRSRAPNILVQALTDRIAYVPWRWRLAHR